jgi:hypothetical protein
MKRLMFLFGLLLSLIVITPQVRATAIDQDVGVSYTITSDITVSQFIPVILTAEDPVHKLYADATIYTIYLSRPAVVPISGSYVIRDAYSVAQNRNYNHESFRWGYRLDIGEINSLNYCSA